MIKAIVKTREFVFARPATTSRGTLFSKRVHFLVLYAEENPSIYGIGECSLFPGLSADDRPGFREKLDALMDDINGGIMPPDAALREWPSIAFALETAVLDLKERGRRILYPSAFTEGRDALPINGLIWMGPKEDMAQQIAAKLAEGFRCLKLKIGALNIEEEFSLLASLRKRFPAHILELRVDANGAFSPDKALPILERLARLRIHSIEQPIRAGQPETLAALCQASPLPIALDEELIGPRSESDKRALLRTIKPHYIVLKPGLLGGLRACGEWIESAAGLNIGWWITSSLETNIGLNAIAQWTYTLQNPMRHGLSTGKLFQDNVPSPLRLNGERLSYSPDGRWEVDFFSPEALAKPPSWNGGRGLPPVCVRTCRGFGRHLPAAPRRRHGAQAGPPVHGKTPNSSDGGSRLPAAGRAQAGASATAEVLQEPPRSGILMHHDREGLTIDGTRYAPRELADLCRHKITVAGDTAPEWEKKIYRFISDWIDGGDYVEQWSSGSTGRPKRFSLPKKSMIASAQNTCAYFKLTAGQSTLLCLPMDYIAGKMMVVRAFEGILNLLPVEPSSKPPLPDDRKIDFCAMTPLQVFNLARSGTALSAIRKLIIGGAEIPAELEALPRMQAGEVYATYGMAETCSHVAIRKIEGARSDRIYRAMPDVSFGIDQRGCLVVKAGWLDHTVITGDVVDLIDEHAFRWVGRYDNLINSGGFKVVPEEVESAIAKAIGLDGVVMGLPDPILGQKVVLALEGEDRQISLEELRNAVRDAIPKHAHPREIRYIDRFPRNRSFKVDRIGLRERLKE